MNKVWCLISVLMIVLILTVQAAQGSQDTVIKEDRKGTLNIDYKENTEGTDPICGAQFTAYLVSQIHADGSYDLPGEEPEEILNNVKSGINDGSLSCMVYKTVTDSSGCAAVYNMEQGVYVVEESVPAKDHFQTDAFLVSIPFVKDNSWCYEAYAEPKPYPAGRLRISKTVHSYAGDKDREFHFMVTLDGVNEPVHYLNGDRDGFIMSGECITLKDGEQAVLDMIPVGTAYKVTEIEADKDGFITSWQNAEGHVMRSEICEAAFTNAMLPPPMGDYISEVLMGVISIASLTVCAALIFRLRRLKEHR